MKKMLFLICLLLSQKSFSQYCLGDDERQVMIYVKSSKDYLLVDRKVLSKNTFMISWYNIEINAKQTAYFKNSICDKFSISPDDESSTKNIVETINKKAVKKTETEWREYTKGKVIKINMEYASAFDKYIFYFSIAQ